MEELLEVEQDRAETDRAAYPFQCPEAEGVLCLAAAGIEPNVQCFIVR